jgi:hypothetical protein
MESIYYVMDMTNKPDLNKHKLSLFKKMAKHLLRQMKKSENAIGCAYRSPEGLKCPVGVLIKDKYYNGYFEGASLSPLPIKKEEQELLISSLRKSGVMIDDKSIRKMLKDFQVTHDCFATKEWLTELYSLADFHIKGMSQKQREKMVDSCLPPGMSPMPDGTLYFK